MRIPSAKSYYYAHMRQETSARMQDTYAHRTQSERSQRRPSPVAVTPATLIGLICYAGRLSRFPARPWPLEAALESLVDSPVSSMTADALRHWPSNRAPGSPRFAGARSLLRDLAGLGAMSPIGRGWDAAWAVNASWVEQHRALFDSLETGDQRRLCLAGQRAVAISTTWSKNSVAPVPATSLTLTS